MQVSSLIEKNSLAQRQFYEHHKIAMFKLCRLYVNDRHTAEDLLQEGFVRVFSKIETYDPTKANIQTWMRRIFTNTCLMHLRKNTNIFKSAVDINSVIHQLQVRDYDRQFNKLDLSKIYGILHELPEGYRVVFVLFFIEGMTHLEIAEYLGITKNTSKSQLSKSKQKMKLLIAEKFPEEYANYAKLV